MTTILRSNEFTCPSCVKTIEHALGALDGVQRAAVHFATGRIEVEHDAGVVDAAKLQRAVAAAGYAARVAAF